MGELDSLLGMSAPHDPYTRLINRGVLLRDSGDFNAAIECFSSAAGLLPSCPVAFFYLADAHNQRDESGPALRFSETTIQLCLADPTSHLLRIPTAPGRAPGPVTVLAFAWQVRGSAQRDERRPEEAFSSASIAVALEPYFAQAWLNRGGAAADMGRLGDALASVDTALRINPHYQVAQGVMSQLESRATTATRSALASLPQDILARAQLVVDELRRRGKLSPALEERVFDVRAKRAEEAWRTIERDARVEAVSLEETLENGVLTFQRWGAPHVSAVPTFEHVLKAAEETGQRDLEGMACFCLMFVHIAMLKADRAVHYGMRAFRIAAQGRIEIRYTVMGRIVQPAALSYEARDVLSHLSAASVDAANKDRHEDAQRYLKAVEELRRSGR